MFVLTFRVVIHFLFSVQSRFFILHSEPLFTSSSTSRLPLPFGVRSHIFILEFGVVSSYWRSELSFVFSLGVQSLCSSSIWRSGPHFHFDFQSRCLFSVWHFEPSCISFVRRSEPYLQFGVQSHTFSLMFRVDVFYVAFIDTFSVRHSGFSCLFFPFDIQIHHYFPLFLAFSTIGRTPSGLLSHIFILHFCIQSHFSYLFMHFEPPSFLVSAFRAIFHTHSGIRYHDLFLVWRSELLSISVQAP